MWMGAAVAVLVLGATAHAEPSTCRLEAGPTRTVVRVIDGETFVVDGGAEVRLAGAMSPRAGDTAASDAVLPLEETARRALEALILGNPVALAFEGRRTDRYGRLLAQVFTRGGAGPVWVQGHMLRQGLARAHGVPESAACLDQMLSQERLAREENRGLWSEAVYRVRSAWRTGELLGLRSTYQIVEGRVAGASERGGRVYLNFGQDWRQDFTAGLDAAAAKLVVQSGIDVRGLAGRQVRIRGWIERRGGPYVEVRHPYQIELLPAAAQGVQ
jgi:endonuclease YncB( thermonuclease family)